LQDNKKLILKSEHFVMRGAVLRNTSWIIGYNFKIGCVVYTGMDTKLMRNAEKGVIK
jgi:phospholipid-transporting ATPase